MLKWSAFHFTPCNSGLLIDGELCSRKFVAVEHRLRKMSLRHRSMRILSKKFGGALSLSDRANGDRCESSLSADNESFGIELMRCFIRLHDHADENERTETRR